MAKRDFDVTVKFRNNHLVEYREGMGWSAREFAAKLGLSYVVYIEYESLRESPFYKRNGLWKESALRIAEYMNVSPDDIWPDVIQKVKQPKVNVKMEGEKVLALANMFPALPAPEDVVLEHERKEQIAEALDTLTPRERLVLKARFGFLGDEHTLKQVGEVFMGGRTRERAREVEAKALRKLRGGRHRHLKELIDTEDD